LNVISILSEFPLILFDKMDIGKTNAARPNNMSNKMIPKILMDVLKLKKTLHNYPLIHAVLC
jgi:hypothetical protein